jgi:hypothetical protein
VSADQEHARGQNGDGLCLQNGLSLVKDLVKIAEYKVSTNTLS